MKVETTTKLIFTGKEYDFLFDEVRSNLEGAFCNSFTTCKNCPFNRAGEVEHECMVSLFFQALDQITDV